MTDTDAAAEPGDLLDRMMGAAGAHGSDQVMIAGSNIELLVGLVRRGFARAECAGTNFTRRGGEADILLIPAVSSVSELAQVMARLGRCLHQGGVAVLYVAGAGTSRRVALLRRVLDASGLALTLRAPCRGGAILAARKIGGATLIVAA